MYRKFLLILTIIFFSFIANGQITRLANQYYSNGEYEKAVELYMRIINENKGNHDFYFTRMIDCYISLKKFELAQKIISEELMENPTKINLYVTLGNVYERMGNKEKADREYSKSIGLLDSNIEAISNLAKAFTGLTMYEEAIEVYEKGGELLGDKRRFALNLANLYQRKGDESKMITNYLYGVQPMVGNPTRVFEYFEKNLSPESYDDLQSQLYTFIQKEPQTIIYPEILQWSFLHSKAYKKALRQARALDRKLGESGGRVYEVGMVAYNDESYDVAIEAFEYILDSKSINSTYYLDAQRALLNAKRNKVTQTFTYTTEDLASLDLEYANFLSDFGTNTQTAPLMIEYAEFQALYLNDLEKAREILQKVIGFGGLKQEIVAKAKLDLGDYYLMDGERWESSLLFSQVDKDFKEGVLGEQARFRNAMLSYFMGDFEWAQEQFDILKSATTRLISNDAIDMSVFIMDNLNLDTTSVPMELYATSELLIFQNKYDEAIVKLDSIQLLFPEHTLLDDILYSKAQIAKSRLRPQEAIGYYNEIIEKYPEEIRCDNAIYELAKMYELQMKAPEKAKVLYEKLFMEFESSTFAVDARKRFRVLRKDEL
jgi:tetratricopeptide (TPR) repeat protein